MPRQIPPIIKIGPYHYTVHTSPDEIQRRIREEGGEELLGHHDSRELTITIDPEQAHDQTADTLLHEILHAVVGMTNLDDRFGRHEEEIVSRLTPALLSVIRDNPSLIRFLA
jgi:hypothetical protein